jgi:cytochrome c-type biogenesis protein
MIDPAGQLTLLLAILAGIVSFLSPCVLPVVPAYLAQITAVSVATERRRADAERSSPPARPSRWVALRHAAAFVAGFGLVFTVLGLTATYAGGFLFDELPLLRQVGGAILVVLGLSLAGLVRIPVLERAWRPLDAGAQASLATASGAIALASPGPTTPADRLGGWIAGSRVGWLASLGLGAIFALGWTPCIGIVLGGILTLAATRETAAQGGLLLAAYSLGLGLPFLLLGAAYDRAGRIVRGLGRYARAVTLAGGLLVAGIGVAIALDLLTVFNRYFFWVPPL